MKPHHREAASPDRTRRLCLKARVDPVLGLAWDLVLIDPETLLFVGETRAGRRLWIERGGMALTSRDASTEVHYDVAAFRASLAMHRPPVALDRRTLRHIWQPNDTDPRRAAEAFEKLLEGRR